MRSGLATSVLAELVRRGETLASAESLTGGMVGQLLTDVPGASASYLGGVISYATRLKATLAGLDVATLANSARSLNERLPRWLVESPSDATLTGAWRPREWLGLRLRVITRWARSSLP